MKHCSRNCDTKLADIVCRVLFRTFRVDLDVNAGLDVDADRCRIDLDVDAGLE